MWEGSGGEIVTTTDVTIGSGNKTRVESDQPGFSLNLILVLSLKLPIRLKILDNDIYLNYLVSKSC